MTSFVPAAIPVDSGLAPPPASALEILRGRLSRRLDPGDPLGALAPLIDSLRSASEYGRAVRSLESPAAFARSDAPLRTFPVLDELLQGGLPRGKLVEMIGARSSGRFSAVLAAVAAATAAGEAAALVDLGDGLDPQSAAALGADLRRLLWLRPTTLKQALAGAEILLGGGLPLVVLDLGNPPLRGGRGAEAGWLRLARAAQAQGAALLVSSPYRVSGTAAAAVVQAARGRARWQGGAVGPGWLLDGLSCRMTVEKCRGRRLPVAPLGLELRLSSLSPALPAAPAAAAMPITAAAMPAAAGATPIARAATPAAVRTAMTSTARATMAAAVASAAVGAGAGGPRRREERVPGSLRRRRQAGRS